MSAKTPTVLSKSRPAVKAVKVCVNCACDIGSRCHRFPPAVCVDGFHFPLVTDDDFCFEWRGKGNDEKPPVPLETKWIKEG